MPPGGSVTNLRKAPALEPQVPTVKPREDAWFPCVLLAKPMGFAWLPRGAGEGAVLGVRQREVVVLSTPTSPSVTLYCLKFCLQNNFEAKHNLGNRGKWLFPFLALFTAGASVFSVPSMLCTLHPKSG